MTALGLGSGVGDVAFAAADATHLVTDEKAVLGWQPSEGVQLVTPRQFVDAFICEMELGGTVVACGHSPQRWPKPSESTSVWADTPDEGCFSDSADPGGGPVLVAGRGSHPRG
ncbi:MAG: hypothetical protein ACRELG_12190 [Gemmataceae bacterium]